MSELFMKRPSAKLYPEYYIVIKTPIDFKEIYRKIKKDIVINTVHVHVVRFFLFVLFLV